jgi:hypothetical protein
MENLCVNMVLGDLKLSWWLKLIKSSRAVSPVSWLIITPSSDRDDDDDDETTDTVDNR